MLAGKKSARGCESAVGSAWNRPSRWRAAAVGTGVSGRLLVGCILFRRPRGGGGPTKGDSLGYHGGGGGEAHTHMKTGTSGRPAAAGKQTTGFSSEREIYLCLVYMG